MNVFKLNFEATEHTTPKKLRTVKSRSMKKFKEKGKIFQRKTLPSAKIL